jgi:hypothetical protein
MVDRNIKFRYLRKKTGDIVGCIVVNTKTRETGWSYCTGKLGDRFTKKTARKICMDRLGKVVHGKTVPHQVTKELAAAMAWLDAKSNKVEATA